MPSLSFVAAARVIIPTSSPATCTARLLDYPSWERWMPASFRPAKGPGRALALGDTVGVRIQGVPGVSPLRVVRLEPGRVVAWSGGVPGVLAAVHAFYFEPDAASGGTLVRSEEVWRGALAALGPVARRVKSMAERVGEDQIGALARDLGANPA